MNYFLRTPRPHLNYACRFANQLHDCPPGPQGEDIVADGDTDVRMDSTMSGLREVSGIAKEREVDEGLHGRILSYVGEDGLSQTPYAFSCAGDMPGETLVKSLWTTGWTIRSLTERWLRGHEPGEAERARKMARALKRIASWDTGRAYYPGGFLLNGEWIGGFFGANSQFYTVQIADLMHYATVLEDEEIADFAHALARGIVAGLPGRLGVRRFRPDGSFTGHTHIHTRVLWGVAMAGRVMRDPALVEWARHGYEFVRCGGADFGWFPERFILAGEHPFDGWEERTEVSETCCTGDMTQTAAELARAGHPHYWDHVERYVTNYLMEMQFALTAEVEEFYRYRHRALPPEQVEQGLAILRDYEGGFISDAAVNQWSGVMGFITMAGCCPPEGARALVTAWNSTVTRESDCVRVNMNLDHDGPTATVSADSTGVKVTANEGQTYMLRPPAWAERKSVRAWRAQKQVNADWQGDYVRFPEVRQGEEIALTWPVPRFNQHVQVGGRPDARSAYTVAWEGNRVLEILPPGRQFPIFRT